MIACKPQSPEGTFFLPTREGYLLVMRFKELTTSEIHDVQYGRSQFRVFEARGILFFLSRFGLQKWYRTPCHRGLPFVKENTIIQPKPGWDTPLHVVLVDANTGRVRASRTATLPFEICQEIFRVFSNQSDDLPSSWEYRIQTIFKQFSVQQMAVKAALKIPPK